MGIREDINLEIKEKTGIDVKNSRNNAFELAKITTDNLLNIFSILEEKFGTKRFKNSGIRGRLRGYMPLTNMDGHLKMKKIEVPLVRLVALLKTWTSELNLLSGYNNQSNSGGKFSIDLAKKHNNVLKLAEVKEWEGNDPIIFTVIEIITNFIIYLIMRRKESGERNAWAIECEKFQLEIIAPGEYYANQGVIKYSAISKKINESLSELIKNIQSNYFVKQIKFTFREVVINDDKQGLIKIMKEKTRLLTDKYLKGKPNKKERQQLANEFGLLIRLLK